MILSMGILNSEFEKYMSEVVQMSGINDIDENKIDNSNTQLNTEVEKPELSAYERLVKARKLCCWSIGCCLIPPLFMMSSTDFFSISEFLSNMLCFGFPTSLCAIVLVIVARVKCPESKFAKTLMWIYIAVAVLIITAVGIFVSSCFVDCHNNGCDGMGID